jgi:hypothetical protein
LIFIYEKSKKLFSENVTLSQPQMRSETPKGRTPPDWVNSCMTAATRETWKKTMSHHYFKYFFGVSNLATFIS